MFKPITHTFYGVFTTLFSASAQCPTITNPSPPPICDASGYTFANLSTDFATNNGSGIVWYNAPTGGSPITNSRLVLEGTYYVDNDSTSCSARTSITITFQVSDSQQSLDGIYCSNENPTIQTYINDVLASGIPPGGRVDVYDDSQLTLAANNSDALPLAGSFYYVVFVDSSGCKSQIEIGSTAVFFSPSDPTPPSPQLFCLNINPTIGDLDSGITGAYNWYLNIDEFGDPILPVLSSNTPLQYGITYYVQSDEFFCNGNVAPVSVFIDNPNNPGVSTGLEYCSDSIPNTSINLFDQLGGTPDTTGIWFGPLATRNNHLGTVDVSLLSTSGTYMFTYTIPENGTCPSIIANVVITINEVLASGTPSTNNSQTYCISDLPTAFDLSILLDNADAGGTWTQGTSSSDPVVNSTIDLSGFSPAIYNFTYTQNGFPNPCPEVSTTVQVEVLENTNAGNAVNQTFCENDLSSNSPFNLFDTLDGSQNNNSGTWTDFDNNTISTTLDITEFSVSGSPYVFTYRLSNGTCVDAETISINIEPAPESGTVNTPIVFCIIQIEDAQTYNLFYLLENEDPTGTWTDDNNSGALTGSIVAMDALAEGTYNFTFDVDAIGICDDVDITVRIIVNDTAAPVTMVSQEFCDTALVSDLIATGNTIQWYDTPSGGTLFSASDALVNGQTYYASQTDLTTGCESSERAAVSVSIYQTPSAGNPSTTSILVCNNANSVNLNEGLDGTQDAGGIWQDTDATNALTGSVLDATGLASGTYQFTYLVTASSPCLDAGTTITVTVDAPLNAGTDTTLEVCDNSGTTNLFTLLGSADTGGTWSPDLTSGTGVFDPIVDASTTYTYTLSNSCGTVSSQVVVSAIQAPNAGEDNTIIICMADGATNLFPFLGDSAQVGGAWSLELTSGTDEFDPEFDPPMVYTYTVLAQAPCSISDTAQITVVVDDSMAPTVINSNPEYCQTEEPTVFNLNETLAATGTVIWYEDATLAIEANPTDALMDNKSYYATQISSLGCESSSHVQVTVTVNNTPMPILTNLNQDLCINDNPTINELVSNINFDTSLYTLVWYDLETGSFTISENTSLTHSTTYYAALVDVLTGCESSERLAITPDLTDCDKLIIPDGFSPNGDRVNDTFDVDNLSILYPNFEIEIFNRNGNIVYKGHADSPRFDGRSNKSGRIDSGDLPVGVYFYIFKYNNGEDKPRQGRLYLSR